ncbi:putative Membralin [Zostera marina]|uniref:Putative Membralin n=1 Tax=Zostera marina TaxID=29655 RepID=A0A0K9PJP1_ZOSMR|nr:putative Membralin [Zostera marina]
MMKTENQGILAKDLNASNDHDNIFSSIAAKFLPTWINSVAKRIDLISKYWKNEKDTHELQIEHSLGNIISNVVLDKTENKDDLVAPRVEGQQIHLINTVFPKTSIVHIYDKWHSRFSSFWKNLKWLPSNVGYLWNNAEFDILTNVPKFFQALQLDHAITFVVQLIEKRSWEHDSTYLYVTEKGYFLLSEDAKSLHNIRTKNVSLSSNSSCFGNRWQKLLINKFIGYDTILTNSLLSSPGAGYLYNYQTEEFYDLTYHRKSANVSARLGDYLVTKCSVFLMSLFVFFTTTMSVSFTLRETQSRMLKLTVQLQHHAHHHLPTFQLIFVHVIESLVFVPIMIGILFFLFEFYNDQLLAFLILTLVWLCELFTTVSVRTPSSMKFFPRFFFLYFLMFHIYLFSYTHGFFYLAFSATAAFMQHLILFFWNRYEVPALQRILRNQNQFRQQAGVHITSTFLTSTLRIGRLNMRNSNIINRNQAVVPETRLEPERMESVDNNISQQQTGGISDSTEMTPGANPFSSFLPWLFDSSLSRDFRNRYHFYMEPPLDENEAIT